MTAAGNFADKAEALGWTVTRSKLHEPRGRKVRVVHGREHFVFMWRENDKGNIVFWQGWHGIDGAIAEEWSNISAALRIMAEPGHIVADADGWTRLPFDPRTATDADVLDRVQGRELTWRNSVTGELEAAIVPFQGRHTHLRDMEVLGPEHRVLTFASFEAGETPVAGYPHGRDTRAGFRSVRLSALVAVGDRQYKPRGAAA